LGGGNEKGSVKRISLKIRASLSRVKRRLNLLALNW
jgi:hypothetical protein